MMSWKKALKKSFELPVLVPGITHFQGTCNEQGRCIDFDVQGYVGGIEFFWKATVTDLITGESATVDGYYSKDGAMKHAVDDLFAKLIESNKINSTSQPMTITESSATNDICESSQSMTIDCTVAVSSVTDGQSCLTVSLLEEHLKDLVEWENVAIHLPGITPVDTDMITKEHRSINDQKLAFYKLWLRRYPSPIWEDVITALKKNKDYTLAERIKTLAV